MLRFVDALDVALASFVDESTDANVRVALRTWIRTGELPPDRDEVTTTRTAAGRGDGVKLANARGFENVNPDEIEQFKAMGGVMERQKPRRANEARRAEAIARAEAMKAKLEPAKPVP